MSANFDGDDGGGAGADSGAEAGLYGNPSGVMGVVSVVVALVVLAFGISEVRRGAENQPALSIIEGSGAAKDLPVLRVGARDWRVNGKVVSEGDLVFRLSGLAGKGDGVIVEYGADVAGARVTQGLDLVNRAGFSQVGLRLGVGDGGTSTAQMVRRFGAPGLNE